MKNLELYEGFMSEKSNVNYDRVIPRDLFNESKLLKCMGQLCLMIHDGLTPVKMKMSHDGKPFEISLMDEGCLTIKNMEITINGEFHTFKTTYNSKDPFPLYVETDDLSDVPVFDDHGKWDQEFIDYCKTVK